MSTIQEFDYSVDLLRALLWQYNKAERLESLLTQKQAWYTLNQSAFWDDWVRDVFDLRTANEFGCQVWAIVLGLRLTVTTQPTTPGAPVFGFGTFNQNFTWGNFGQTSSGTVVLTVEQQRLVLRLRYFQLVTRCTVPEINRFMASIFADEGPVYVQDANDMSAIVYVFGFPIDSNLRFIFDNYDLLPRPATVGVAITVQVDPAPGDYLLDELGNYLTDENLDRLTA